MKKKYLTFIRIICFFLLCICLMWYFSNVLTARELNEYPKRNEFWQTINAQQENSIDLIFVGDSSVMHSVVPMQIWKKKQITSYNMSFAMMKPQEAYYGLKKLFKKQSPKYVFFETQMLVCMKNNKYDYHKNDVKNTVDYIDSEIFENINSFLPVMEYKQEWNNLHLTDFIKSHPEKINSIFKGYTYDSDAKEYKGKHPRKGKGVVKFKDSGDIYFNKIYKLCDDNNCKIVLMTMPQGKEWNQKKHNTINELAKQYGVDYLDYDINLKKLISDFSWKTDTKDAGKHLNYSGAKKVTREIENYIQNKLCLKPTRLNSEENEKWNNDMKNFYALIN